MMKKTLAFIIVTAAYMLVNEQANATSITNEENQEPKKVINKQLPLNHETEELMKQVLALNEVYKQADAGKKVAPNSGVLNDIEENTAGYIADLKNIMPLVEKSQDKNERKSLLEQVYRKNNPFATFYL